MGEEGDASENGGRQAGEGNGGRKRKGGWRIERGREEAEGGGGTERIWKGW